MVRLNKIYTRTGDKGTAGLVDGSRVSKASARMASIGDVDEANASLGMAIALLRDDSVGERLRRVQNELFDLGADIATPADDFSPTEMALRIIQPQIERLEHEIDRMNEHLDPLRSFILPGGSSGSAQLHLARAVVRRAERSTVEASRHVAAKHGGDVLWRPGATR
jgi:cob(I)alamin adenosyltransferase